MPAPPWNFYSPGDPRFNQEDNPNIQGTFRSLVFAKSEEEEQRSMDERRQLHAQKGKTDAVQTQMQTASTCATHHQVQAPPSAPVELDAIRWRFRSPETDVAIEKRKKRERRDKLLRAWPMEELVEACLGTLACTTNLRKHTPASRASRALAHAHAALEAHLEGVHPGLVTYIDELHNLGVDTVEDLRDLDEESIESLNLKKLHRAKFMTACGK